MIVWGNTGEMVQRYTRVWLYGPPGTGKTLAAAFFPKPFFILPNNENSHLTLLSMRQQGITFPYAILGSGVTSGPANIKEDMETLLTALFAVAQQSEQELHARFGQTIVLESASHYTDLLIGQIAPNNTKMTDPRWGEVRSHWLHIRDMLWRLPAHIVITALADKRPGKEGPSIPGQAGDLVPGTVDTLGYCETQLDGQRTVNFAHPLMPSRCRLAGVPPLVLNTQLWQYIAQALG